MKYYTTPDSGDEIMWDNPPISDLLEGGFYALLVYDKYKKEWINFDESQSKDTLLAIIKTAKRWWSVPPAKSDWDDREGDYWRDVFHCKWEDGFPKTKIVYFEPEPIHIIRELVVNSAARITHGTVLEYNSNGADYYQCVWCGRTYDTNYKDTSNGANVVHDISCPYRVAVEFLTKFDQERKQHEST